MLKWRKENGVDAIREKVISGKMTQKDFPHHTALSKCYPHTICHGYDKHGQSISVERLGRTNPALLTKLVTLEQLTEYQLYHLELKAEIGRAVQQECRDRSRMPSSA
eukprot:TRINITY_DN18173_c0_g1_i10.p1 TRINITY_DN18173_c0_g1~~TRINITY_DN18173_c0_g1_i10.p1  ORF type:complete len:107 (+),score=19.01 TRINITY_DN18173_c0_g1_i10:264-584(+)